MTDYRYVMGLLVGGWPIGRSRRWRGVRIGRSPALDGCSTRAAEQRRAGRRAVG